MVQFVGQLRYHIQIQNARINIVQTKTVIWQAHIYPKYSH